VIHRYHRCDLVGKGS